MRKNLKKIVSLFLCICVLMPTLSNVALAEEISNTMPNAEVTEENKNDADLQNKTDEKEKTKDAGKVKSDKATFTLSVLGNGNAIIKLKTQGDEDLVSLESENKTFHYSVGDEVYVKSYAVDGNETTFNESGCEVVSEKKGKLTTTRIYKINSSKATLEISFTGGEKENSSKQTPKNFLSARASSSMSTTITAIKHQYGYDPNGSNFDDNKYTRFNATGAYNNAAYCAEHSRIITASSVTGYVINDSTIRKILYYGYRGVKPWSGFSNPTYNGKYKLWGSENTNATEVCGISVTAQALSDRYNALGGNGISRNPSGLSAFMSFISSQPTPDSSFTVYKADATGQDMMWAVYEPNGYLTMTKEVANNKDLVAECPNMYTLEGAEYTVKNSSDKVVGTLRIDKNGKANTLELPVGTYTVKETKAPNGFAMDNKTYTVNVTSNQTATFTSKEVPLFDPLSIVLEKVAEDGKGSFVNKNADMSNAEFTIKYYDSIGDDVSNLEPIRTWKLKTIKGATGKYQASLRDKYLIEGSDEFFKTDDGIVILPRGQITIQETKAPIGYKVDPKIYQYKINSDDEGTGGIRLNFGNTPEQPNSPLVPKIKTTASDIYTKDNVGSYGENIVIEDKVSFSELVPNKTYTIKGKLMEKESGRPLLVDEKEVTAEKTFTVIDKDYQGAIPDGEVVLATVDGNGASGEVTLTYELNKKDLAGLTTVVFEKLYHNGKEIANHEDINDEKQTIHFPKLKTTATSEITGTNLGMPNKEEKLIDKVDCKNLIVGKEYTIKGKLMNKKTGEPLLIDEKEVTVEKTFTATEENMIVELVFTYDSSKMQGETTVVFEDMYHNGVLVGTHSDLEDEGQTITYPNMGTKAWITTIGKKANPVTILDRVFYTDLQPDKEYTIKGRLMDKKTGEPFLTKEGKEVVSEITFTPTDKDGFVELPYKLSAKDIEGKSVVVFEDMYYNDEFIMTHSDINDENQTVAVGRLDVWFDTNSNGYPLTGIPNTGDTNQLALFIGMLVVSGIILSTLSYKKHKERKEK